MSHMTRSLQHSVRSRRCSSPSELKRERSFLNHEQIIPAPPIMLGADVQVQELIEKAIQSGRGLEGRKRRTRDLLLGLAVLVLVPVYALVCQHVVQNIAEENKRRGDRAA